MSFRTELQARWERHINDRIRVYRSKSNRASEIGHPCIRKLVYGRLIGDLRKPYEFTLQTIFDEGRLHESAVKRLLSELGFEVLAAEQGFEDKEHDISGHIDGLVLWEGNQMPIEIKTMNQFTWEKVDSVSDMLTASNVWVRGYPHQMNTYMHLTGTGPGLFVLKNKQTGGLKFIEMEPDAAMFDADIQKATEVNGWMARLDITLGLEGILARGPDELPPCTDQGEHCVRCDYRGWACFPEGTIGTAVEFLDDMELLEALDRREELKPLVAEYKRIDAAVKAAAKGRDAEQVIVGQFHIRKSMYQQTIYEVPDEIRLAFATKKDRVTIRIINTTEE